MATVTVYLTSGQTITYEGNYKKIRGPAGQLLDHQFGVDSETGLSLDFIRLDTIAAVTVQEAWV
jgi:hypothetical protein